MLSTDFRIRIMSFLIKTFQVFNCFWQDKLKKVEFGRQTFRAQKRKPLSFLGWESLP